MIGTAVLMSCPLDRRRLLDRADTSAAVCRIRSCWRRESPRSTPTPPADPPGARRREAPAKQYPAPASTSGAASRGHPRDRKCAVEGKSVSVRGDTGGRRNIKKKKRKQI